MFATQPITNVLLEKRKKMVKELKRCSLHHVAAVPECNAVFIFIQFVPSLTYTLLHSTTTIIIISILQLVILNCSYVTSTTMTTGGCYYHSVTSPKRQTLMVNRYLEKFFSLAFLKSFFRKLVNILALFRIELTAYI